MVLTTPCVCLVPNLGLDHGVPHPGVRDCFLKVTDWWWGRGTTRIWCVNFIKRQIDHFGFLLEGIDWLAWKNLQICFSLSGKWKVTPRVCEPKYGPNPTPECPILSKSALDPKCKYVETTKDSVWNQRHPNAKVLRTGKRSPNSGWTSEAKKGVLCWNLFIFQYYVPPPFF